MKKPLIHHSAYIARESVIRGDVEIGKDCSVWFHATIRAEQQPIRIGHSTNIQDNVVLHIDDDYPVSIGNYVSIGHGAIVHGCTVRDRALVGMGAIILNGAVVGEDCIIGAGALVPQNMVIPDGHLALGVPAKVIRPLSEEEKYANLKNAYYYIEEGRSYKSEDKETEEH